MEQPQQDYSEGLQHASVTHFLVIPVCATLCHQEWLTRPAIDKTQP